jgi:hypothetical protein
MGNTRATGADWVLETIPPIDDRVATLEAAAAPITLPRVAAGVPSGAPTAGENGIAFDTTASTGGLYAWNGSAWVKGGTIP